MELRPQLLLEGLDRRDALLRDRRGVRLPARGVRDLARPPAGGDRRPRAAGAARRRRRLVRLRRGDGDARVDGGPPRDAAAAAAVSRPVRLPRPADADQQRRDARPRRPDRRAASGRPGGSGRCPERCASRGATRRRSTSPPGSWSTTTRAAPPRRSAPSSPAGPRAASFRPAALDVPLTREALARVGGRARVGGGAGLPGLVSGAPPARRDDALLRRGVLPEVHAVPDRQPRAAPRRRGAPGRPRRR